MELSIASPDVITLPIVRLEDRGRRLRGDIWAKPFPPASAAWPISYSRIANRLLCVLAAEEIAFSGVIAVTSSSAAYRWSTIASLLSFAWMIALYAVRERVDDSWLRRRITHTAKWWPPVTVFGVIKDDRLGDTGWVLVAFHPEAYGEDHYTRRPVVLRHLQLPSSRAAAAWHQQLADISKRARHDSAGLYHVVPEPPP